ncbi:putative signal peptide-containing protein [Cryptosporidium canis]|uniref:Signal peptide-containing protein n=1 Tax=Cryptosporidium canis TaxID=195482 RepID=A0ABQ8PAI4_9CRYT|nr:putative signal peptide-containing protein [Cryptosporidium canis]KAJ1615115.1 putative signal peptide-containing protein [Cryptosporidium canis]
MWKAVHRCLKALPFAFMLILFIVSLHADAAKEDKKPRSHKDPSLVASPDDGQFAESAQGEPLSLFEAYSESLKFVLEGMFGPEYAQTISGPRDAESLPLCRENEQMVNKGCNIMMYSCSRHKNGKFLCYFYYWSFCQCSRPWKIKLLNYLIPPVYDCYPSVASEEDFSLSLDVKGQEAVPEKKGISALSEDLEIPVGKCGVNIIFVAWILLAMSFLGWVIYRLYRFGCYIKSQIALSNRKRR